jgi:hypothetical protein
MRYLCFVFLCFFTLIPKASAALLFSEIMYDHEGTDTDHEWVEVYNPGDAAVSLVGVRFNDGSNHTLNEPPTNGSQGTLSVPAGGYMVIAQNAEIFLADYSGYTGTVLDTVMSLSNTEETIKLIGQSGETLAESSYTSASGGAGDGKTLNWNDTSYVAGDPTPGSATAGNSSGDGTGDGAATTGGASSTSSLTTTPIKAPEPKRTIEISTSDNILRGVPLVIKPVLLGYSQEPITYGKLYLNFGDGETTEVKQGEKIEHTYQYAGAYTMVLEWYESFWALDPVLTVAKVVRVEDGGVNIEILSGGAVKIKNSNAKIADISDFRIVQGSDIFIFPKRTRLAGVSAITVTPKVLGFTPRATTPIQILNPYGDVVASFPDTKAKKVTGATTTVARASSSSSDVYIPSSKTATISKDTEASVGKSDASIDTKYLWLSVFGLFILGMIAFVWYIKNQPDDADGYELLDE